MTRFLIWRTVVGALSALLVAAALGELWLNGWDVGPATGILLGGAGIYGALIGWDYLFVLLRVILVLLPLLALAGGLVWFIAFRLEMPQETGLTKGSLVIGIGVAVGWFSTWLAREYGRDLERRDVARDTMLVLRAEVFAAVSTLDDTDWKASSTDVQRRIREGGEVSETRFMPVTLRESPPILFEAIAPNFASLPDGAVRMVAEFYAAVTDLSVLAEDLRAPGLIQNTVRVRVAAHERITNARLVALQRGINALYVLNDLLGDLDPAGERAIPRTGKNSHVKVQKSA
ncbi:MAG: hypothetical protein AAFQ54_03055 [Pseudomonadota bacterium]